MSSKKTILDPSLDDDYSAALRRTRKSRKSHCRMCLLCDGNPSRFLETDRLVLQCSSCKTKVSISNVVRGRMSNGKLLRIMRRAITAGVSLIQLQSYAREASTAGISLLELLTKKDDYTKKIKLMGTLDESDIKLMEESDKVAGKDGLHKEKDAYEYRAKCKGREYRIATALAAVTLHTIRFVDWRVMKEKLGSRLYDGVRVRTFKNVAKFIWSFFDEEDFERIFYINALNEECIAIFQKLLRVKRDKEKEHGVVNVDDALNAFVERKISLDNYSLVREQDINSLLKLFSDSLEAGDAFMKLMACSSMERSPCIAINLTYFNIGYIKQHGVGRKYLRWAKSVMEETAL